MQNRIRDDGIRFDRINIAGKRVNNQANGKNVNVVPVFYSERLCTNEQQDVVICESDLRITVALIVFGIAGFVGSYIFGYMQDR